MRHLVASLALLCFSSFPAQASLSPEEVAEAFYSARLARPINGVPGGMDLASWSQYLGPELVCLLGAARRYNDAFAKALPDETPPFSEGDLFSSASVTPSRFTPGKPLTTAGRTSLLIEFQLDQPEQTEQPVLSWEDRLHLIQHKRQWVINDIEYLGGPRMADSGRLVENLRKTLGAAPALADWDARQLEGCPQGNELARLKAEQQRKEAKAKALAQAKKKKAASKNKSGQAPKKASPQKPAPKK